VICVQLGCTICDCAERYDEGEKLVTVADDEQRPEPFSLILIGLVWFSDSATYLHTLTLSWIQNIC